jgi:hemerythrin superfamily protein
MLIGHAGAEEAVIYPAMSENGESGHAKTGYNEQVTVKLEIAELETLDPAGDEYEEKLENIRQAFAHHVYEEEGTWYPNLKRRALPSDQSRIMARYQEEYKRYCS